MNTKKYMPLILIVVAIAALTALTALLYRVSPKAKARIDSILAAMRALPGKVKRFITK